MKKHLSVKQPISDFFEKDHREIDAIYAKINFERPKESLPLFQEFSARLDRHINWEENILFPAIAKEAPAIGAGPIRIMNLEHKQIRSYKQSALDALLAQNSAQAQQQSRLMLQVLGEHNRKEEQIVYPACDELLSKIQVAEILQKVKTS